MPAIIMILIVCAGFMATALIKPDVADSMLQSLSNLKHWFRL